MKKYTIKINKMNDSFYITLTSNVKSEFFENTTANFKTKLAKRIELEGEWEVGLAAISYTYSWYNLSLNGLVDLHYFDTEPRKIARDENKGIIYAGRYDTIDKILDTLNYRFDKMIRKASNFTDPSIKVEITKAAQPNFIYDEKTRMLSVKFGVMNNRYVFPEFSKGLSGILGLKKLNLDLIADIKMKEYVEELKELKKNDPNTPDNWNPSKVPLDYKYNFEKPVNLENSFHSLFVYCDLIRPALVGDSYTQLLRVVEIPPNYKYGDQIVCNYPDTYYHDLLIRDFDSIEIDIKDDTGDQMPFEYGRSIIILHFRKKN